MCWFGSQVINGYVSHIIDNNNFILTNDYFMCDDNQIHILAHNNKNKKPNPVNTAAIADVMIS